MRNKKLLWLSIFVLLASPKYVLAQTSSSPNYSVEESSFGSGSGFGSSSSFGSQFSIGDVGVGSAFSTSYGAYAGPISPNEEYLEVATSPSLVDLGILSNNETSIGVGSFYVRAYLNSSYVVLTASDPPTSENGAFLDPITSAAAPSAGVEQFGINLVENACPAASVGCSAPFGANAVVEPNATYANGEAAPGYNVPDTYQYNKGDTIAQNGDAPAWGQTNYTISYIVNISVQTSAGLYSMDHSLVAVPTF
jgi:hypothetical protein